MGDRPSGSSRALRLDPYALPVRYAAHDSGADGQVRDIELDRERVVLRREVRGIRMKIGVLVTEFAGVTMRTLPPDGEEPAAVAVMLEHRDNGLTVPLFVATEGDDLIATKADRVLWVPAAPALLQPVVNVIPLQLLAYYIGIAKNYDVDKPRNLAKSVTVE